MEDDTRQKIVVDENQNDEDEETENHKYINTETMRKDRQHKLSVVLPPARSRSPVTVQEWVAALPDHAEDEHEIYFNKEEKDSESEESEDERERDMFTLGAEGNPML